MSKLSWILGDAALLSAAAFVEEERCSALVRKVTAEVSCLSVMAAEEGGEVAVEAGAWLRERQVVKLEVLMLLRARAGSTARQDQ